MVQGRRRGLAAAREKARGVRAGSLAGLAALAAACSLLTGCGLYSTSAKMNPHLSTVAVPTFGNETVEFGLETELAEILTQAFIDDNNLKVVGEGDSDSILTGSILRYQRRPYSFDENENIREYRIEIAIRAEYLDKVKNHVLWKEAEIKQWTTYTAAPDEPSKAEDEWERENRSEAMQRLAEDIVARTVQGW